jgi:hypothetical protein
MELLDQTNTLEQLLGSIKEKKISIVTAFASGTENLIQQLLDNNNQLELIIGTINAFSSPKLIDFCSKCDSKNISTFVDFRYQNSIHWKLYLVEPNQVIIGSANFTTIGIKLTRDTCVVIHNKELFDNYATKITELKANEAVIKVEDSREFNRAFNKYRLMHDRFQAGMVRSKQYETLTQWLEDDTNQSVPLSIWDSMHSPKTIERSNELLKEHKEDVSESDVRDFFTYDCDENDLPYKPGDVVLTVKNTGAHLGFFTFDEIIYDEGRHYIYSYKRKRYLSPFKLNTEEKGKLKILVPELSEKELIILDRSLLEGLVPSS